MAKLKIKSLFKLSRGGIKYIVKTIDGNFLHFISTCGTYEGKVNLKVLGKIIEFVKEKE